MAPVASASSAVVAPAGPAARRVGLRRCKGRSGGHRSPAAGRSEVRGTPLAPRKAVPLPPHLSAVARRCRTAVKAVVEDAQSEGTSTGSAIKHFYRTPGMSASAAKTLLKRAQRVVTSEISSIDCERCFNIETSSPLTEEENTKLLWILRETYEPELLTEDSCFENISGTSCVVEVGPRMSFSTALSSNAVSICNSCGLDKVTRVEVSRRFLLSSASSLTSDQSAKFASLVHDRMTEQVYPEALKSFAVDAVPAPVKTIPVMTEGRAALEAINEEMGLAFDEQDLDYYLRLFQDDFKRDPTTVELFDIGQSNSEHSRHWFFGANLVIDGETMPTSLFKMVKEPLEANPTNSVIGFHDNSSAIRGGEVQQMLPRHPGSPSPLAPTTKDNDLLLTAETHNFPCAVAPYPGAETGAGGRIRDTHATGIGSIMGVASAGYCTGNLNMEDWPIPGENPNFKYPDSLASPEQILIDASNGASDYGNKFGEPLVLGYTRTYGQRIPNGERREWLKPIMFSAGMGQINHSHLEKDAPEEGMLIVKIGGPAYRIGMGGGAASSLASGSNKAELDFNAVQRGDAEMSQKLWRVVRACVELGDENPIVSLHDQGAGGNCNVVKEIVYPKGGEVDVRAVKLGDETLSVLEIWGAEYQENDCLLLKPKHRGLMEEICARERCLLQIIGTVTNSGHIVVRDSKDPEAPPAVNLNLEAVLGDMPKKTYKFTRVPRSLQPLSLVGVDVRGALDRVLKQPAVCSKRFLTTKVDRSVTGLVAQQQCVGPMLLPISDCAVMAQTHFGLEGLATSIGEAPIKGLIDPAAMARMAVGESLTNLVWAHVTSLNDVKSSVNWMYAAKMASEGVDMYDAAAAIRDTMIEIGMAIDGGKDSLSMAAACDGESVMAPGNIVVSAYARTMDITKTVTQDLKLPGSGRLLLVDLASGKRRLGGSALAQSLSQLGDQCPDVVPSVLKAAFNVTQVVAESVALQGLVGARKISAGHDVSDGGVLTSALEMAFAGNCGLSIDLPAATAEEGGELAALFAEELGLVVEVAPELEAEVLAAYAAAGVTATSIGSVTAEKTISVSVAGSSVLSESMTLLRDAWEATSFQLDRRQAAEECVEEEQAGLASRENPVWKLTFAPTPTPPEVLAKPSAEKVRVAILREEGSNGDREMASAVHAAGMESWDITMSDLLSGRATLDSFQGIIFVGGFSYADVMDSAKGWAAGIKFSPGVYQQFEEFYHRPDTFSLGICNGCQLMALLGWVPGAVAEDAKQPRFVHNKSGRFESRFSQVRITASPAVMLKGMEGSTLGVWVAHGEGQALFPDSDMMDSMIASGQVPVRYVDPSNSPTTTYPYNPNGSPEGIASMCSPDGRHLAMMPHPERVVNAWQNPWYPVELGMDPAGPGQWLKLFQNAREWCEGLN